MKEEILAAVGEQSVPIVFFKLWNIVRRGLPTDLGEISKDLAVRSTFFSILMEDDEEIVCKKIKVIVDQRLSSCSDQLAKGISLELLGAIDEIFAKIHPRREANAASIAKRETTPFWLKVYKVARGDNGCYYETDTDRLIPKGPLSKEPRLETASFADSLEDKFSYLSVASKMHLLQTFSVFTKLTAFAQTAVHGYSAGNPRRETITFLPLAEEESHLNITCRQANSRAYAKYSLSPTISAADSIISLLSTLESRDLVMAPEFVVNEGQADAIASRYGEIPSAPKLLVCGSGDTNESREDKPWNESRVINMAGVELWRQRKFWIAGIKQGQSKQYRLMDPGADGLLMEDSSSGDHIMIADVDALGRCIILICQDFEGTPLLDTIVRSYQPDWVFVPVLDKGVPRGRWGHQRAFGVSALSHARFVIASSTALCDYDPDKTKPRNCGLVVGPKNPIDGVDGRIYAEIKVEEDATHRHASITWGDDDARWKQTEVS